MADRLALHGGRPVRSSPLPYGRHAIDAADVAAVVEALTSDRVTVGPRVAEFERAIADRVGAPHAIAVSSGTAALHVAVAAAGIGRGDEVIMPALTFAATGNAVLYQQGVPVFADVRPDSWNLDPDDVARNVGPRTRAIVGVDFAGLPCDLDALRSIARRHGLVLIEDAAHSLGATCAGVPVGTLADVTTLSFHPVKHITTGEGGMVLTGDEALARRAARFRTHGIAADERDRFARGEFHYEMVELGFNYRLTELACALGLSQLAKLDRFLARREAIALRYRQAFSHDTALAMQAIPADVRHAWHIFPVLLDQARLTADRGTIFAALRAEGIGVNVHYVPVYWHPYYRDLGYARGLCPVTESLYERLVTLPLFPAMSDGDVDDVITAVSKVLAHFGR